MSWRPISEQIEDETEALDTAIKNLKTKLNNRIDSNNYTEEHRRECFRVTSMLLDCLFAVKQL